MSDFVGLEKLSLVDFDNLLVCTLFTKTCNFRCPFCHNKDLALSNINNVIPFSEIVDFLKSRIGLLDGVCITGGEPTLMPDLEEKLRTIKSLGFKVKLDTNGYRPNVLKRLIDLKLIDYVAMDIKNSLEKYELTTGTNNLNIEKIIESIKLLKSNIIPYEFRTTIVKEFHEEEDIKKISHLIKGAPKYFLQKFVNNENCIDNNLNAIDKETALSFINILKNDIAKVELRGY